MDHIISCFQSEVYSLKCSFALNELKKILSILLTHILNDFRKTLTMSVTLTVALSL